MSAKNWKECPQCAAIKAKDVHRRRLLLEKDYGKIPLASLIDASDAIRRFEDERVDNNLGEYYEFTFDDEKFSVRYEANCNVCGFNIKHTSQQDFKFDLDE